MFQELRAGSPIYAFNKKDLKAYAGEVVRLENQTDAYGNPVMFNNLVPVKLAYVDVIANIDGGETRFTKVSADASLFDYPMTNGVILADNTKDFVTALTTYKKASEKALADQPRHEEIVEKCNQIIAEYDPQVKAEKEQSKEIAQLKEELSDLKGMLTQFLKQNTPKTS